MRVIGYREFCNKLWNIVRFALGNFPPGFQPRLDGVDSLKDSLSLSDKWILTRLSELIASTNKNFDEFKLGEMATGLYDFWKKELADVYLEATKPVMKGSDATKKEAALNTLYICLDVALKLLHPTMPYLTEELYQRLPHAQGTASKSISIAAFPNALINFHAEGVEQKMDQLLNTKKAILSQLSALNVASNAKPTIAVQAREPAVKSMFDQEKDVVQSLVKSGETIILSVDE